MRPVCGHAVYANGCKECKLYSVRLNVQSLKNANSGTSVTMGMTDREYAKSIYELARKEGREDPLPLTRSAAAIAPKRGVFRKPTGV